MSHPGDGAGIVKAVEDLLAPIARRLGVDVVDVEYLGAGRRAIIRILADRPGGITVDECARVSEALGRQLDALDLIARSYTLEVASPGLDRPLKRDEDFHRFAGRMVEITTFQPVGGRRRFKGVLVGLEGTEVVITVGGRDRVGIPREAVAQARLVVEISDLRADLRI